MRGIAAGLGIDPSLVIHHFTSKENLPLSIPGPTPTVLDALDGPRETLGRRILEALPASARSASTSTAGRCCSEAARRPAPTPPSPRRRPG
ncbi:helix-turn-helix transcriptional regulator [Nonomuraea sp. FMUSA5-5]|uniref:Helix-turn-helix transcriptional regulator n=1 Tax=Nonomuraea composti TaxID=2720023 RepID=A0ABX1B693_9ACTN|nr:helix-turn-helix transcriptional regulator [Nonomuraea sp. FMUSA5-5]NJP91264.1 helix-turn-helix transcriptional regulator [Nonomuraea sp. FMUSA5-5]